MGISMEEAVKARWLGREAQIDRLLRVLGPRGAPVPPVFVGGLPSCGKTAVVRDLFKVRGTKRSMACLFFSCPPPVHGYANRQGEPAHACLRSCVRTSIPSRALSRRCSSRMPT